MSPPDTLYHRLVHDEGEAKRLDAERARARRSFEGAFDALRNEGSSRLPSLLRELEMLESSLETSFAFYLRHTANDALLLTYAFGPERARELAERLSRRKLALLAELDRVRELRGSLERECPGSLGPGTS